MARKAVIVLSIILCAAAAWIAVSGFSVNTGVFITDDFTVSDDGGELTFRVSVGSSMGYVRDYKDEGSGVKPHYLKFYSAWGGLNSRIGAKDEFTLKLSPQDTEIYIYRGDEGYVLALRKDMASGEWYRVNKP